MSEEKLPLLSPLNENDIENDYKDENLKSDLDKLSNVKKQSIIQRFKDYLKNSISKQTATVLVYVVLYILSGVINSLLLKKVMNVFTNYGFFLNQLTNYGYVPIFGAIVLYKILFTNDIPKDTRSFPQWKFVIMGALDAVTGYFVVIGGIKTTGPLQQLLNQSVIPFTMLLSFIFLKERYSLIQLGGALIIIGGVVVSLIPSLTGGNTSGNMLFYNFFYLISMIPYAFSNVYKAIGFSTVEDMDVWYLQYFDALYQSLVGTVLFPINNWLPPPSDMKFNQVIPQLKAGGKCLGGINTLIEQYNSTTGELLPTSCNYGDNLGCDNCHGAWVVVLIYMAVNVLYNVFILLVLKHAGATVFSIANTLRLPLTNIAFSFKFIMGSDSNPFSGLSVAGLCIILLGLGGYRVGSMIKQKKEAAASADSSSNTENKVIPKVFPTQFGEVSIIIKKKVPPKSQTHLRNQFFGKLGITVPESKLRNQNSIYGDQ
ncbi:hypothetical protein DDB_G0277321 [Dictyostelium discoideum AX4]|uniref:Crt homolog 2 n=1 Tax=Dictyostelium discoideum TaxID=44689 RepID=CRTP2_DICDI|nr:hypothetical protein DDB_G0277321 [Dictyostelium discoideum AX4]Q550A6.1 RecName: Full=Crt homolog 2; AltName: Full=Chloroquine resistance transporter paralog 2; Short=DdCRTp2 [Dictyostelium discoideum]EAL68847.1 hypothetical protein DDB_G0277321 [Dictyostelium discoideum AX4]|eukprot:XP_642710.1 hypothetical protein DDB_G0277321 [Dictyostelium discoideum AX4]